MNVQIEANDIKYPDDIFELVNQKISSKLEKKLANFNLDMVFASLRIKKDSRWGYITHFSMTLPGKKQIVAESKQKDLENSLSQLEKQVSRQITQYKDKLAQRRS